MVNGDPGGACRPKIPKMLLCVALSALAGALLVVTVFDVHRRSPHMALMALNRLGAGDDHEALRATIQQELKDVLGKARNDGEPSSLDYQMQNLQREVDKLKIRALSEPLEPVVCIADVFLTFSAVSSAYHASNLTPGILAVSIPKEVSASQNYGCGRQVAGKPGHPSPDSEARRGEALVNSAGAVVPGAYAGYE
jgi:hypothetical protein